jgi:hypothetical protein
MCRTTRRVAGLIEGYDCELRKVQKSQYHDFFGYALWFYGGNEFDALQIVWPDKSHRFPWDEGCAVPVAQQSATW